MISKRFPGLFPEAARYFPGQRWVNIGLRAAHLIGVAGIAGGFLFDLPEDAWAAYWTLTLASGIALSLLYLWSTLDWLFELKGLAIIVKMALLALAVHQPALRAEVFALVIVISAFSAHAPARIRGYRWADWRVR